MQNGVQRVKINNELQQPYGERGTLGEIKIARLRWAGHLQMRTEERIPKRVPARDKPGGRRPNKRLLEEDLRRLDVRR